MAYARSHREMRAKAQSLRPTIQVGKEGLTPEVVEELRRQVKAKGLVKVRLNASFGNDAVEAGAELAEKSSSDVVDVRGRTVVLCKR